MQIFQNYLNGLGLPVYLVNIITYAALVLVVALISVIANWIAKKVIVGGIERIIRKTKITWDDVLIQRKVFWRLSHLAPGMVIYYFAYLFGPMTGWIQQIAMAYMLIMVLLVIDSFLSAFVDIYRTFDVSKRRPIHGFVQIIKIILYIIGGIIITASLLDKSPWALLGSLGALTAVLMLVFKDTILGLVAGIQISATDMIRVGDWLEMPKYGADGDVVEISLHTIRVQNWDKTFTMIPSYALISDSFKNWRGMEESGGRRIKRAVHVDMRSIKLCTPEMLDKFTKFQALKEYLTTKQAEIDEWNRTHEVDHSSIINGRRLTNVGLFRAYIIQYLKNHPLIRADMTFLVRQLQPGAEGLPIQIYVFSSDTRWVPYEDIQSDIFDHLLAVVPEFELRVFQNPTGHDFRFLGKE
jgi:miniconductance mechanosensitive channel